MKSEKWNVDHENPSMGNDMMDRPDGTNNGDGSQLRNLGWRIDCLGDMSFFPQWSFALMFDVYLQNIVRTGMSEAWKKV